MCVVEEAKQLLATKIDELKADHRAELEPLEAALAALDGHRSARTRGGGKSKKPSAKREIVEPICLSLLRDNGALDREELEALAKHKLTEEEGRSLSGFKQAFAACLSSEAFAIDARGLISVPNSEPDAIVDNSQRTAEMS